MYLLPVLHNQVKSGTCTSEGIGWSVVKVVYSNCVNCAYWAGIYLVLR